MRILSLLAVAVLGGRCFAAGPCAVTPAAAVKAFEGENIAADAAGYRVVRMHRDAVLGTRWAAVERCGHPEWPGVTVAVGAANTGAEKVRAAEDVPTIAAKVVKAGETIRFWSQEANVRMEMAAVCDEAGAAGDRIRVRVTTHQEYGDSVRYLYGLVHGPADVEMVR